MNRRQSILASIASLLGLGGVSAQTPPMPSPDRIDAIGHPRTGEPQARVYRWNRASGQWLEVAHVDIRDGDRLLSIGVSDGRLWKLETMHTSSCAHDHGRGYRVSVTDHTDLLPR